MRITEAKELIKWMRSEHCNNYGIIYNQSLRVLGYPHIWISKAKDLKKLKDNYYKN